MGAEAPYYGGLPVMPIFKLLQEMFVNTCVKFRDNQLRNEVCRAVMPFQGGSTILGGYMQPVMPMFRLIQEMMFVNTYVKFCHNWLRNEVCRAVTPLGHVRTNIHTGRSLYTP